MAIATTQRQRPAITRDRRPARGLALAALVVVVVCAWGLLRGGLGSGSEGATPQHSWDPISEGTDPRLVSFPWVTGQVRDGDVYTVLSHFAERFDAEVEPIDLDSSWGWDYRPVRGHDDVLSNHASGTAIDLNAPAHPLGSAGTFSEEQLSRLRELLDEVAPVLAWGGDFERPDEMHFEIVGTPDQVAQVAARVTGG